MKSFLAGAALVAVLGSAAVAQSGGYVNTNVNLRAGPGTAYPVVTILQTGTPLEIFGCLDEYTWCDVDWRGYRGWVAAQYLDYDYRGRRVEFYDYAPRIGVPIVTFSFGNYWDRYYRGRPWYSTYDRWGPPPPRRYPPPPQGGPGWGGPGWNGPPPGGPGWGGPPPGGPGWGGPPPGGGWGNQGRPPQGGWGGNNRPPPQGGRPPQQGGPPPQQGGPGGPPPQQGRPPQQAQPPAGSPPRGPSQDGNDCAVPTMPGCRNRG